MAARRYVGAGIWVPDDPSLPALQEAVQGCQGCDLFRDATQLRDRDRQPAYDAFVADLTVAAKLL